MLSNAHTERQSLQTSGLYNIVHHGSNGEIPEETATTYMRNTFDVRRLLAFVLATWYQEARMLCADCLVGRSVVFVSDAWCQELPVDGCPGRVTLCRLRKCRLLRGVCAGCLRRENEGMVLDQSFASRLCQESRL
ncbi:hypothetical protein ACFE04_011329 [Oxalis oulophora]